MPTNTPLHILILGLGAVTRDFARNWPEPVLARALARRGHRVTAVGYYEPGHPAMTARRETIDGVESLRVTPSIWPSPQLGRALDSVPRPDVMHIFHFRNVFVYNAVAWARRRGVPIVHSPVGPFHDAYLVADRERPYTSRVDYDRLAYTLPGLLRAARRPSGAGRAHRRAAERPGAARALGRGRPRVDIGDVHVGEGGRTSGGVLRAGVGGGAGRWVYEHRRRMISIC